MPIMPSKVPGTFRQKTAQAELAGPLLEPPHAFRYRGPQHSFPHLTIHQSGPRQPIKAQALSLGKVKKITRKENDSLLKHKRRSCAHSTCPPLNSCRGC